VKNDLWDPASFDGLRRQLIPSFDLLYNSAVSAVALTVGDRPAPRILDLAAGTGLLSAALRKRLPEAILVLTDGSERMLGRAMTRFSEDPNVTTMIADLTAPPPDGPFDAVMSGLAIHHLEHEDKKKLFGWIHGILAPGGLFVNVEQVLAPAAELEPFYDVVHETHVIESQTPPADWAAGRERMKFDICIDVGAQLDWLKDAGFSPVDCLAKDWRFATYAGWKPAP
jgi:tRNA (cmo5U34)-methyltransferase